jgi:hypothetical protein
MASSPGPAKGRLRLHLAAHHQEKGTPLVHGGGGQIRQAGGGGRRGRRSRSNPASRGLILGFGGGSTHQSRAAPGGANRAAGNDGGGAEEQLRASARWSEGCTVLGRCSRRWRLARTVAGGIEVPAAEEKPGQCTV